MTIHYCEEDMEYAYSIEIHEILLKSAQAKGVFWDLTPMGGVVDYLDGTLTVYGYECERSAEEDCKAMVKLLNT